MIRRSSQILRSCAAVCHDAIESNADPGVVTGVAWVELLAYSTGGGRNPFCPALEPWKFHAKCADDPFSPTPPPCRSVHRCTRARPSRRSPRIAGFMSKELIATAEPCAPTPTRTVRAQWHIPRASFCRKPQCQGVTDQPTPTCCPAPAASRAIRSRSMLACADHHPSLHRHVSVVHVVGICGGALSKVHPGTDCGRWQYPGQVGVPR